MSINKMIIIMMSSSEMFTGPMTQELLLRNMSREGDPMEQKANKKRE